MTELPRMTAPLHLSINLAFHGGLIGQPPELLLCVHLEAVSFAGPMRSRGTVLERVRSSGSSDDSLDVHDVEVKPDVVHDLARQLRAMGLPDRPPELVGGMTTGDYVEQLFLRVGLDGTHRHFDLSVRDAYGGRDGEALDAFLATLYAATGVRGARPPLDRHG